MKPCNKLFKEILNRLDPQTVSNVPLWPSVFFTQKDREWLNLVLYELHDQGDPK